MVKVLSILSCAVLATVNSLNVAVQASTASIASPLSYNTTESNIGSNLIDHCPLQFRFHNGQCTDWADARYYQLTCHHTQWWGNAKTWPAHAMNTTGWVVSTKPRVPSIIAIQPGYQGCDSYGHVAVVESINEDGSVHTSDWNYIINGKGGPYITTYVNFYLGEGVSFIWHDADKTNHSDVSNTKNFTLPAKSTNASPSKNVFSSGIMTIAAVLTVTLLV
ncbi:hypothetical protein K7432_013800 [Basidiobolus ranarum]|uniref:Peptidase C51 domain-containing protein n=1 Tax=Basidiobolus ranarum TaxID=34480 RepID=A0ABR2VQE8_9FUNG